LLLDRPNTPHIKLIAVGSQNGNLNIFKYDLTHNSIFPYLISRESEGSVMAIEKHPIIHDLIVTGDYSGGIIFYKVH
jgi:hypothetical protein